MIYIQQRGKIHVEEKSYTKAGRQRVFKNFWCISILSEGCFFELKVCTLDTNTLILKRKGFHSWDKIKYVNEWKIFFNRFILSFSIKFVADSVISTILHIDRYDLTWLLLHFSIHFSFMFKKIKRHRHWASLKLSLLVKQ